MKKNIVLIKLGGSCLTYKKEGIPKIRQETLNSIVKEIKEIQLKNNCYFVIVHGGGSITHPLLDKYNIVDGCKTGVILTKKDKVSAAKIHLAMNLLNKKVVQTFLDNEIPAWPIQTSSIFVSENRNIKNISIKSVKSAIKNGYIPILHGDFILDKTKNICICSGDFVTCLLAKKLKANKVLFASDIDGIYDDSKKTINKINLKKFVFKSINSNKIDHSGGMNKKIEYIKKYCSDMEVIVFNGLIKNNLTKIFLNQMIGTKITTK